LTTNRNGEILEELKAEPVDEKLNVTRININRTPKLMFNYRRNERRGLRKTFEKTVRRGCNRYTLALLVLDDDDVFERHGDKCN
jgi:hypothetical protein